MIFAATRASKRSCKKFWPRRILSYELLHCNFAAMIPINLDARRGCSPANLQLGKEVFSFTTSYL
jgi:hypothetical protein